MSKAKHVSTKAGEHRPPISDQQVAPSSVGPQQNRKLTLAVLMLGIASILLALVGAWRQAPRPFPLTSGVTYALTDPDWWRYPIETNPALRLPAIQGKLRGVHALPDGKVWVVGEGGLILHSPDGGLSWRQQHPASASTVIASTSAALPGLISGAYAMDPRQQRIDATEQSATQNALPDLKQIQQQPLQQKIPPINETPITKTDTKADTTAAAIAAAKTVTKTITPEVKKLIEKRRPKLSPKAGTDKVGSQQPAIPKQAPVNPPPIELPPEDADLYAVFFQNASRGWAAGDQGMVWSTGNGGNTWQAGFIGDRVRIVQIYADNGFVLAISAQGRVFGRTDASDAWQPFEQLPASPETIAAMLLRAHAQSSQRNSGTFATPAGFWQIGPNGEIRHAKDAPENWQTRPSGTQINLAGIAFADADRGWIVGDAGVILHSDNAGASWRAQSGGETALAARRVNARNLRLPAPWTWLTLLLGAGLLAEGVRRLNLARGAEAQAVGQTAGIAGLFVSDQPLKPGDADHLGHARIARGLADFIRNRNTEPGLTLAVTGSWGSGKSSIMRLLEDDLKHAGFRPAWFNAWHHQQEGRQLASMFNTIRSQAVPPIHTPAAWRVRAALYWNRGWFYRLLALGVLGLFLLGFLEAHDQHAPLTQLRQAVFGALMDTRPVVVTSASLERLKKDGILQTNTLSTLRDRMIWQPRAASGEACLESNHNCRFDSLDQLYASLNQEMAPVKLTDEEKQALETAVQHLGDTSRTMFGVLLGALVIPLLLGKGLAVYGLNYLDLFKRLLPDRGKVEGKEAVGTMENFRKQFCNLTQALDGRLVLFIDDLDRCDCATVREVLELVNYLVSVGQCFVVLGMAMEHVACCIEPKTPQQEIDGYAMQYLKKLVNIEVPVPKADLNGIRAMLESQAAGNERPLDIEPTRRWAAWMLALLALAGLTYAMHQTWTRWQPDSTPKTFLQAPAPTAPAPDGTPASDVKPTPPVPSQLEPASRTKGPVGLMPEIKPETSLWTTWLSLLALAAIVGSATWTMREKWLEWLHQRGILQAIRLHLGAAERKRDTPAFRAALESWHQVIVAGDPTPRGIKRFVNRVRFLAMMEQAQESDPIPEGVLVGLAALHHAKVDWSALDTINQTPLTQSARVEETEGENSESAIPRTLQDAVHEAAQNTPGWPPSEIQAERFLHIVEFMHVR